MTSFVRGQHFVFVISIFTGECAILILQKLRFGVCHSCNCLVIYDDYVIVLCFFLNCHRTYIFSQIPNLFICGILKHNFFAADKATHWLQFLIINNKYRIKVFVIKASDKWKTVLYRGSADSWKGDCESDLNSLASGNIRNTLLYPTGVSDSPGPARDIFSIAIVDLIFRSALVRFNILRPSYYYNTTRLVCYVYLVYKL